MANITFSGLASGMDTDALIKALTDSRRVTTLPMKKRTETNTKESEALETLRSKLLELSSSLSSFLTLNGGALNKTAVSSDSDSIGVSAINSALPTSFNVTVSNLAQSALLSFDDRFSSKNAILAPELNTPQTVELKLGSTENAKILSIEVTNETTLLEFAEAINQQSGGCLAASVINTGTDQNQSYALVISSSESGSANGELTLTVPEELSTTGLFTSYQLEQAHDAVLSISGIGTITRPTNQISNIIPGVTLNLKRETPTEVTITVANDIAKTTNKLEEVVAKYNELFLFQRTQSKIERIEEDGETTNVYGDLAGLRIDDQFITSMRGIFSELSAGTDPKLTLADLGIKTERDGTLSFDQEKFADTARNHPTSVEDILQQLGDKTASATGLINGYTRFDGQLDLSIKANKNENEAINSRIERVERYIEQQTEALRKMFASFEAEMGRLNSGASSLASILSSLQGSK